MLRHCQPGGVVFVGVRFPRYHDVPCSSQAGASSPLSCLHACHKEGALLVHLLTEDRRVHGSMKLITKHHRSTVRSLTMVDYHLETPNESGIIDKKGK